MTEQVIFTNPSNERKVAEFVTYTNKEAGFWIRFWAFIIDSLIVSSIIGICINPIFHLFDWNLNSTNWYAPIVIISGIIYYAYFVLMTKFFAQTLGKMIFGLKVKKDSGEQLDWMTVLFREGVGRFVSNTFMKLPYLIVVVTPNHKALHDFVADTVVIHEETYKETRRKKLLDVEKTPQIVVEDPNEKPLVQVESSQMEDTQVTSNPIESNIGETQPTLEEQSPINEEKRDSEK